MNTKINSRLLLNTFIMFYWRKSTSKYLFVLVNECYQCVNLLSTLFFRHAVEYCFQWMKELPLLKVDAIQTWLIYSARISKRKFLFAARKSTNVPIVILSMVNEGTRNQLFLFFINFMILFRFVLKKSMKTKIF